MLKILKAFEGMLMNDLIRGKGNLQATEHKVNSRQFNN
jgi:hypothetical protein